VSANLVHAVRQQKLEMAFPQMNCVICTAARVRYGSLSDRASNVILARTLRIDEEVGVQSSEYPLAAWRTDAHSPLVSVTR
jgi:hypothetical protein